MRSRRFGNASNPTLLLSALLLLLCLPSYALDRPEVPEGWYAISESELTELETISTRQDERISELQKITEDSQKTISEQAKSLQTQGETIAELGTSFETFANDALQTIQEVRREILTWKLIAATLSALTIVMAIK